MISTLLMIIIVVFARPLRKLSARGLSDGNNNYLRSQIRNVYVFSSVKWTFL